MIHAGSDVISTHILSTHTHTHPCTHPYLELIVLVEVGGVVRKLHLCLYASHGPVGCLDRLPRLLGQLLHNLAQGDGRRGGATAVHLQSN